MKLKCYIISFLVFSCFSGFAQRKDSLVIDTTGTILAQKSIKPFTDTSKTYNPNIAVRRSAIIPGWGQATNKKYWKIPVVYAALGTTTYLFFRNLKQYREAREAYILATDLDPTNDYLIKDPYFAVKDQPSRIRSFRNEVRQNLDYSALFFIVFWGLNVVDAAVDAHLKTFDVSDDLSLKIKAGYSPVANTNGVSVVLGFGNARK